MKKLGHPPNYVWRIGSNWNFEVILRVKKARNAKSLKVSQSFLTTFG